MTYSDETLKDYLNGALPDAESEAIELTISMDEALQRRMMALDPFATPVADAFQGLPGKERIESLRAALPQPTARTPRWWTGAAMAASVALGVVVGSQFLPSGQAEATDWRIEVARYQALYVPETVAYLGGDDEKLAVEMDRAADAVGLELDLDALVEVDDLTLRRAQVLGFEGQPLIQLVYTDPKGAPFALCIMSDAEGEKGPAMLAGLATHTWESDSHGFILVGGDQLDKVNGLAANLRAGAFKCSASAPAGPDRVSKDDVVTVEVEAVDRGIQIIFSPQEVSDATRVRAVKRIGRR